MKQVNAHGGGMEVDDTAAANLDQQNIALHVGMDRILSFHFQYQEGDHPVLHDVIDLHVTAPNRAIIALVLCRLPKKKLRNAPDDSLNTHLHRELDQGGSLLRSLQFQVG